LNSFHEKYCSIGGQFLTSIEQFVLKSQQVKALVFDWDGVFTDGTKRANGESSFSEVDSMGINLLRFSYFLKYGQSIPCFIITGMHNKTAIEFAEREKFQAVFMNAKKKKVALQYIHENYHIGSNEIAFFFDDVLDLDLASKVNLRILLGRNSNPAFNSFIKKNQLADYQTANKGGFEGIRESAELIMESIGKFDEALSGRINFNENYTQYWQHRQNQKTLLFEIKDEEVLTFRA